MNMFRAFMELDKINESYYSRQELINNLKSIGRNYKFDKYTDEQLYYIWQKESAKAQKKVTADITAEPRTILYCDECGEEVETLYLYEMQELCQECLLKTIEKITLD